MAIKIMSWDDLEQDKIDEEIKKLKKLDFEIVEQVKEWIGNLTTLEHLYELREYIEDLIIRWDETEELEEDE